jgi:ribonuclease D
MEPTYADAQYVRRAADLQAVLDDLDQDLLAGFDTEFISEGIYEPLLCLIQIATVRRLWIVDPLEIADLSALWRRLTDPEREILVVAAREEIRFCLRYGGRAPEQLLDLQVAAGLVGHGYPLSHTNLVRKLLGVQVKSGEAFTDWRRRPLSAEQLAYAADDVRYLMAMREQVRRDAASLGREAWLYEESSRLTERVEGAEQEERWYRLPGATSLGRRELAVLRELWRWREERASSGNVPPRRILRDEMLVEIARRRPKTSAELFALRGLDRVSAQKVGGQILEAVQTALGLADTEWPASLRRDDPSQVGVLSQLLSLATNNLAAEHRVDPALLATNRDLQDVVRWRLQGSSAANVPAVLTGWRGEILREPLLGFLEGRFSVRVGDLRREDPLVFDRG